MIEVKTATMVAIRLCVGCGVRSPQHEMLRVVHRDGQVVVDNQRNLSGRGAWLHHDPACIERAIKRGKFSWALRVSGQLDTSPLENRLENTMDK